MATQVRSPGGLNKTLVAKGKARRTEFLRLVTIGMPIGKACDAVGWTRSAYRANRSKWADWRAEVDLALSLGVDALNPETQKGYRWDPSRGFAAFRLLFLGRESAWFHLQMIEAMEKAAPGSITLILAPPGSGKTALWEDFDLFLIANNPDINIVVGSEKRDQAGKIVSYVRACLDHDAPGMEMLRERFGPFAPARGGGKQMAAQQWGSFGFSVAKRNRTFRREPTMQAIGMGGTIIGTRTDRLQVDDPQSTKSINQTESLVNQFRQDWLSRPLGTQPEMGRTAIIMNRVGEGDFPEYLIENTDLVDHLIKIPAWTDERGWYWPERYSDADMRLIRKTVGADAWDRNFMQLGIGSRNQTFTEALLARAKNPLRSINHPPPKPPSGEPTQVVLSMDPGFGTTAIHAGAVEPSRFRSLDFRIYKDVDAYKDFGSILEWQLRQFTVPDLCVVRWVQIETKAFQKGLIRDDKILELRDQYGFELLPVETGSEKNDPNLGVQALARMIERDQLDFPDLDDVSRERYTEMYRQLRRWRPFVRGNALEQDVVIVLWFGSMLWRRQRRTVAATGSNWSFRGLRGVG